MSIFNKIFRSKVSKVLEVKEFNLELQIETIKYLYEMNKHKKNNQALFDVIICFKEVIKSLEELKRISSKKEFENNFIIKRPLEKEVEHYDLGTKYNESYEPIQKLREELRLLKEEIKKHK